MFLATTADQRFWKMDEKVLFLGDWCKAYDQKHVWSKMDHEVLPYHWEDQARFNRDFDYLKELYERALKNLALQLNQLHGVDHSTRYWGIVLGAWLFVFIETFYDRYTTVYEAIKSGKVTNSWIPSLDLSTCVPNDYNTFNYALQNEPYNLVVYGWLIKQMKQIPFEIKNEIQAFHLFENSSSASSLNWTRIFWKFLEGYSRCVPDRFNQIIFISSTLELWSLIRLQLALGQVPYLLRHPASELRECPVNGKLRKGLEFKFSRSQFEALLENVIPIQIPQVYIESYHDMHQQSLITFPKDSKVIVTCTGLYSSEIFKFWAGWQVDRGAKLVGHQHGGGYGNSRIDSSEKFEVSCSDRFFSWGWSEPNSAKVTPMPSGNLAEASPSLRPDPKGHILLVSNDYSNYTQWMSSRPIGPKIGKYLEDHEIFYNELMPEIRHLLLLRFPPVDKGWHSTERWKKLKPALSFYRGKKSLYQQLNNSRLFVGTDLFTTHLEALAANFPTILFWRPELFELRESAQPVYKELLEAGIFHNTPQSAAAKVNEIYRDPLSWWFTPEIQKVRKKFCRNFAWTAKTWRSIWKSELLKLLKN